MLPRNNRKVLSVLRSVPAETINRSPIAALPSRDGTTVYAGEFFGKRDTYR